MPKRLLQRLQPDTIAEFRAAAHQRSLDALALQSTGRRTAEIYLWGYVAEMTLKAAYFDLAGFPRHQTIRMADLRQALNVSGSLHHLGNWAQALVSRRSASFQDAYPDLTFGSQVVARAQSLHSLWNETIRYHKNTAYAHEVSRARKEAQWFYTHSLVL